MHVDTIAPADHEVQLRRQALKLITAAIHDNRITRADLRVLVVIVSSLLGDEHLSDWQILCTRSRLSDEEARGSMLRLRTRGYLNPQPAEDTDSPWDAPAGALGSSAAPSRGVGDA